MSHAYEELNCYKAETVWCKIHLNKTDVVTVGVCYKSPSIEDGELEQLL